ncbi:peptidase [Actinoplanes sp. NBRC 14428]|uniref:Neutral metalloproteinase n=1 Tax=Pseudosporangium ferrugineum TaxID=439699 RepID=A0A2T0SD31_9ACTN|nr:M4 family metallopeptidase [Pseudosporangium ferrugineum]PRY31335.1 Zn-dependent metalloprotease [Pseudosporangium ferrugineum]BCJ54524.1 peptidase [Actinoplanes sp. NBRC 14428]
MKRSIAAVGSALLLGGLLAGADATAATAAPAPDPLSPSAHRAAVKASAADAFTVLATAKDADGATHVRYQRTYQGLRVLGGDFILHGAKDGALRSTSVGLTAPLALSTTPSRSAASAVATAKGRFAGTVAKVGSPELVVDATSGTGTLAYETVVEGFGPDGQTPSRLHVVSDARTGAVLSSWDTVETAAGSGRSLYAGTVTIDTTQVSTSSYSLKDAVRGNGTTCDMNNRTSGSCTLFTDADNVWGTGATSSRQSAAVDAHYGAAKTYDYYNATFGRRGIFNNGTGVPSRVHYGSSYVNAFWDGAQMTYGDGSGNSRPLVSLDVAAHEMSHGVTERTANLTYSGESGGLNEATSDIFASMVEFYSGNSSDPGDYQIGEKININGNGTPLRYQYNPSLDGRSQNCWTTGTKNLDVHYSSGVGNHFFFNLAEGTGATAYGTSPVCGSAPAVTGIGRAKAAAIWYRALTTYFTSSTTYARARTYTLSAATDLYGRCSTEYQAVQKAWTAVSVTGSDTAC